MTISGSTAITGIFGYPVSHSLSPVMHNAAFKALGIDYCYVAFPVHPDFLGNAVEGIKALSLCGVNITIPHKEKVIPLLEKIDAEASFIGAVNTIVNSGGILTGFNTDGRGFMHSLSESGITVKDREVLIIGAGGAARAISYYAGQEAKRLSIYNRTREKALKLSNDLKPMFGNVSAVDLSDLEKYDVIINTTPLGLKKTDPLPFDASRLGPSQAVCDIIYRQTPILDRASRKGCKTLDGRGMLLWQGALSFELWTGMKPPIDIMRDALYTRLNHIPA
jgi:shikimate dehydrogenase